MLTFCHSVVCISVSYKEVTYIPVRIFKMIATSGFLTAFGCTKFVFGRSSAPDPAGGAYSAPQSPNWFKGNLLLRMREKGGEGRGGRGEEEGGEGIGRPLTLILGFAHESDPRYSSAVYLGPKEVRPIQRKALRPQT